MYILYYQFVPKDVVRGPQENLSALFEIVNDTTVFYICDEIVGDQLWMVPGTVDPNN